MHCFLESFRTRRSSEVGTIFVKIYPIAVCRPVMKGGKEIRQGGEFAKEPVWLSRKNSVCDDVAQRLAITCKELSYHLQLTLLFFIQVHFIAPAKAKDAKFSLMMI
jgi:hypothetical protein